MKNLSEHFTIKMTSGVTNEQCDRFPNGSYHSVQKDDEDKLWAKNGMYPIDPNFKYEKIKEVSETIQQKCNCCDNKFDISHPFLINHKYNSEQTCIRCYERLYLDQREVYRTALRKELTAELAYRLTKSLLNFLPININKGVNK